jgi:hypothetical protein
MSGQAQVHHHHPKLGFRRHDIGLPRFVWLDILMLIVFLIVAKYTGRMRMGVASWNSAAENSVCAMENSVCAGETGELGMLKWDCVGELGVMGKLAR